MSGLIQRLLDRGAASAPVPGAVPSALSGSPMARFDQRLQDGWLDAAPPPPAGETSFETNTKEAESHREPFSVQSPTPTHPDSQTPKPQSKQSPSFLNSTGDETPVMSESAMPVSTHPMPLTPPDASLPIDPPKVSEQATILPVPLPPTAMGAEAPQTKSGQEPPDSSTEAHPVPQPKPSPLPEQPLEPERVPSLSPVPLPAANPPAPASHPPAPAVVIPSPALFAVVEPSQPDNDAAAPVQIAQPPAPREAVSAPLPPPPEQTPRPEKVVERIVREVPVEAKAPKEMHGPLTAESVSKIGKLPERRRTRTLFGLRRR